MTLLRETLHASNRAMQLTASKFAVYALSVCRRERILRFMHTGLAAAVDSQAPVAHPSGFVRVALHPTGSIVALCPTTRQSGLVAR